MKHIQSKYLTMAYILILLFVGFLFAGFYHWVFFLPAGLFGIGYVLIDRKYLRCPHCGGFTNLSWLSYAQKHTYHCAHCGEIIHIDK